NTVAVKIFQGDPSVIPTTNSGVNLRFGDVLTVRGSGINTEILMDDQAVGFSAGILKPTEPTLTTWTNFPLSILTGGGSIGRSIQFQSATATNFWQKRKGLALNLTTY